MRVLIAGVDSYLFDLGYQPTTDMEAELHVVFADLLPCQDRIEERKEAHFTDIRWDGTRRKSDVWHD
jgi:hypothetical protein